METIKARIRVRRDNANNWNTNNPILADGEIGVVSSGENAGRHKVGDGDTPWNNLVFSTYTLPPGGIPRNDLSQNVVDSLNKADSALQQNALSGINQNITQAVNSHNTAASSHEDIRILIADEASERQEQMQELDSQIADGLDALNSQLQTTNNILEGVHTTKLIGATLTRVLNGTTEIQKSLFAAGTVFVTGKTTIFDTNGTMGVYIGDANSSTIIIATKTISPIGTTETPLIGQVPTNADLPLTAAAIETKFGRTPSLDNYVQVMADETLGGSRAEWYITNIDASGNITWGNPVPMNTGDFQAQTTAADAGKILIGGAVPGTFGESKTIDTLPVQSSNNLISSSGVWSWFGAAVSALKTSAKTVVNAVNELFDSLASHIGNAVVHITANERTAWNGKQNTLNRTVIGNDNATASITDTGGNLSIAMPVTVTAPVASSIQTTAGTRSIRSQVQTLINNIADLFSKVITIGTGAANAASGDDIRFKAQVKRIGRVWPNPPTGTIKLTDFCLFLHSVICTNVTNNTTQASGASQSVVENGAIEWAVFNDEIQTNKPLTSATSGRILFSVYQINGTSAITVNNTFTSLGELRIYLLFNNGEMWTGRSANNSTGIAPTIIWRLGGIGTGAANTVLKVGATANARPAFSTLAAADLPGKANSLAANTDANNRLLISSGASSVGTITNSTNPAHVLTSGGSASTAPAFRALAEADIPGLPFSKITGNLDASRITQNATNRFISDSERTSWNNMVSSSAAGVLNMNPTNQGAAIARNRTGLYFRDVQDTIATADGYTQGWHYKIQMGGHSPVDWQAAINLFYHVDEVWIERAGNTRFKLANENHTHTVVSGVNAAGINVIQAATNENIDKFGANTSFTYNLETWIQTFARKINGLINTVTIPPINTDIRVGTYINGRPIFRRFWMGARSSQTTIVHRFGVRTGQTYSNAIVIAYGGWASRGGDERFILPVTSPGNLSLKLAYNTIDVTRTAGDLYLHDDNFGLGETGISCEVWFDYVYTT